MTDAAPTDAASVIVPALRALAVPIDNITRDAANARRGDVSAIRRSLNVFGQRKPVVVKRTGSDAHGRPTGIAIAGNHTHEAACDLGWTEIAAVFVDDDAATAKAYALADNRTAELADWDEDQLAATLRELSADDFDMTSLGWTETDLVALLASERDGDDDTSTYDDADDVDAIPDTPPVTQPGDVWHVGRHRVICGDATDPDAWQTLMRDVSGPVITFTSPPYNLGKSIYHKGRDVYADGFGDDQTPDEWRVMVDGAMRLAMGHSDYVIVNVQLLSGNKIGLLDLIHDHREHLADIAIWHKTNPAPAIAERVLNAGFEFVLIFGSEPHSKRQIGAAVFDRGTVSNVHSGSAAGNHPFADIHAATMPMHLPRWVIANYTAKATTVVDCFGGLGTTMIAADEAGRAARLIEIDPRYVDVMLSRFQHVTGIVPTRNGEPHDFSPDDDADDD